MQIVIKIPEGFIDKMNSIKDDRELSWAQLLTVYRGFHAMLQNGTPLPKGHGNLVDISELMDMLCLEDNAYNRDNNVAEPITLEDMDRLDVIIPADKEE